jgi:Protein of unknown function (DUF2510)
MKDIRVDGDGEFRCWNCGNKGLIAKRTFRSKLVLGVGSLLTKKKLKCQTCDEYNDTGSAKPYAGPEARKWRKVWEKEQAAKSATLIAAEQRAAEAMASALMAEIAAEAAPAPAASMPPPAPPLALPQSSLPAAWHPDPMGRHQLRYWDGDAWTTHVSSNGVQTSEPM